jgi:hypothetical protein
VKIEPLPGLGKVGGDLAPAAVPSAPIEPPIHDGARTSANARTSGHRARAAVVPPSAKAKKTAARPRAGGLSADDF